MKNYTKEYLEKFYSKDNSFDKETVYAIIAFVIVISFYLIGRSYIAGM